MREDSFLSKDNKLVKYNINCPNFLPNIDPFYRTMNMTVKFGQTKMRAFKHCSRVISSSRLTNLTKVLMT